MSLPFKILGAQWPAVQGLTNSFAREWFNYFQNIYTALNSAVSVASASGIPFIVPSSGTIGNNGAITLTTALPSAFANCFLYLPTNAISTGSAAGWYFAQMSSTTAGTVYNNTYSSGTPSIPGTKTAFVTTGPGAYTQSTAAIAVQSMAITAKTIGANGKVRILSMWSYPNNANSKTIGVSFGGSSVFSQAETTTAFLSLARDIQNRGVQNSQVTFPSSLGGSGTSTGAAQYLSIDTTANQSVSFTATLSVATDYLIHEGYTVEIIPG